MSHDGFELIHTYTDKEAVEDGVLVRINEKDRVTRHLFDWLSERMATQQTPPANWPVDLFPFILAKDANVRAFAMCTGLLSIHSKEARRIYDENIKGGIWCGLIEHSGTKILSLIPDSGSRGDSANYSRIWIIPNELDGLTVMFPDDY